MQCFIYITHFLLCDVCYMIQKFSFPRDGFTLELKSFHCVISFTAVTKLDEHFRCT